MDANERRAAINKEIQDYRSRLTEINLNELSGQLTLNVKGANHVN